MQDRINDDESFEGELFRVMCLAYPKTTVRSLSAALGRSEGYWSSVRAQRLKVSNSALIHLMDYLECRKIQMQLRSKRNQVERIQQLIKQELLNRVCMQEESANGAVDGAIDKLQPTSAAVDQPLPFFFSSTYFR